MPIRAAPRLARPEPFSCMKTAIAGGGAAVGVASAMRITQRAGHCRRAAAPAPLAPPRRRAATPAPPAPPPRLHPRAAAAPAPPRRKP